MLIPDDNHFSKVRWTRKKKNRTASTHAAKSNQWSQEQQSVSTRIFSYIIFLLDPRKEGRNERKGSQDTVYRSYIADLHRDGYVYPCTIDGQHSWHGDRPQWSGYCERRSKGDGDEQQYRALGRIEQQRNLCFSGSAYRLLFSADQRKGICDAES